MDVLLVVKLVDHILKRTPCIFRYVLDVLDLVLQWLAIGLWSRCPTSGLTCSPTHHRILLVDLVTFYVLRHYLILYIRIEAQLLDAISWHPIEALTTLYEPTLIDYIPSLSGALLRIFGAD